MSRLKVILRGTLISEVELLPEKEYVGGRKDGCDIRLQPEKGISREHFKLKFIDGHWQMVAISRFGDVFSLGQKVEQIDLQHGQTFHIPPYDFTFLDLPDAGLPAEPAKVLINVNENEKTVIGAVPQVPYIKIVNSNAEIREMLRLEVGEVWVAGRDPSCQIIIPDQRVSRRQFEIYKVNGAYTILDLASVNGTFLNGSPVSSTDPQTLKSGDAISVLDNSMYFELHDPNFKYKVDNIEIPPIQVEQEEVAGDVYSVVDDMPAESGETEVTIDEGVNEEGNDEVPEIEQYDVPQQIEAGPGPFTGMPNQQFDPNQYFTFDPQLGQGPGGPMPTGQGIPKPPPKTLTQNKPLLIIVVLVFLGAAYWLSEYINAPQEVPRAVVNESDPFSKLTPAQQKQVQELYSLAGQMYNQEKYDLTLEQINKLLQILPTGYKDSDAIKAAAESANDTKAQRLRDETAAKEKAELIEKLKEILASCKKILNPKITSAEMSQCLAPAASIDVNDPEYVRLSAEAERIERERQQAEEASKNREKLVADLKQLFNEAESVQAAGYAFKAIKKYKLILNSDLPDPTKLKDKAKERIAFIEEKIKEKSEVSINLADNFFKEGKLKEAITTLREATVYDPQNPDINDKIEIYKTELTRQVRTLYQESIIDENYGLIDNTETRLGAKEKWKKITDLDLIDGEYYKKAVVKLRRYGVM